MNYNTDSEPLKMAEYGRNIQSLIEHLKTVKDFDKRNQYAEVIIEIMAQSNPQMKHNEDFRQKLWNDLHFLCNYEVNLKMPYTLKIEHNKRELGDLPYPKSRIKYRHYGKNVENMLSALLEIKDETEKEKYTQAVASYMKLAHMTWSKANVTDEEIMNDLESLSEGLIKMDREKKITTLVQIRNNPPKRTFKKSNSKRRNYR
jgi:hypothetical protein